MQIHHHAYIDINYITTTCYIYSQFITPKISSHGLINKHEQFNLNYSTKHIFLTKYFMNAIDMNSETLGLLFTANHPTSIPLCEPKIQWPFRPHAHHNTTYSIIYTLAAQTVRGRSRTVQMGSIIFTLRSQVLGPIKWSFKASNQPNHQ